MSARSPRDRGSLPCARQVGDTLSSQRVSCCGENYGKEAAWATGAGFTLIELIAAMTILLLLTAVALPVARVQVQARARGRT